MKPFISNHLPKQDSINSSMYQAGSVMNKSNLSVYPAHTRFALLPVVAGLLALSVSMPSAQAQQSASTSVQAGSNIGVSSLGVPNTAAIASIRLSASKDSVVADGISTVQVTLELLDASKQRVSGTHELALEVLGARWLDGQQNQTGVTNTHVKVINGVATLSLQAPASAQEIVVKTSYAGLYERLTLKAYPMLRPMMVAGVIELRGYLNKLPAGGIVPPGDNDLFEKELTQTAWEFGDNKGSVGARAAFYLTGKVKGEYLLTAMYDSDKETRARAFRDIDPNSFYPVYGDSSIKGVEAQSTGKFYVRLDHNRSYILYGDFNALDSSDLQLGAYSRLATGAKWHYETDSTSANVFASHDSLKQVVDEYRAVGMSGPYSVSNPTGLLGTEQVDIVVRDRAQPSVILSVTRMKRYEDYEFEPFNNRIMFKRPIASVDAQLNPIWIRIAYEVETGGERFVVAGVNIHSKLTDNLSVSAAVAKDQNPANEYALAGIATRLKLGVLTLTGEVAKSQGTQTGASSTDTGMATRLAMDLNASLGSLNITAIKTDAHFNNQGAGVAPGRQELNLKGAVKLTQTLALTAQALSSQDTVSHGKRDSALVGVEYNPTANLKIELGMRKAKDTAATAAPVASNCNNFNGYQFGFGVTDPNTGLVTCANGSFASSSVGTLASTSPDSQVDSVRLKVTVKPSEASSVYLEHEQDLDNSSAKLTAVGSDYALGQSTRLYGRVEQLNGIAQTANTANSHTRTGALGISGDYMKDGQVFNEYRINGTLNDRKTENALGVRNGFALAPGLRLNTNFEYLKVLTGSASDAIVLGAGLDYIQANTWKVSSRVERRRDDVTDNLLNSLSVARKVNQDWTMLVKNYYNADYSRTSSAKRRQGLSQIGFAYRPQYTNAYNLLGKYEYKSDYSSYTTSLTDESTHTVSLHLNWHPTRVWELSQRVAYLRNAAQLPTGMDKWSGWLVGSRLTYDVNERWSVGGLVNYFAAQGAVQSGYALEGGYIVAPNTLFNVGYSIRGLKGTTAVSNDYRQKGWYFGLRLKFDENVFDWGVPEVNRTMPRPDQSQK